MTRSAPQLDLFGDPQERRLQTENAWLRQRLDNAKTEFRKLRETAAREQRGLQDRITVLQRLLALAHQDRDQAQQAAQNWRTIAELARLVTPTAPPTPAHTPVFKHLLALAHPDKWSQGQPATALAHELAVAINAARAQLEGQP